MVSSSYKLDSYLNKIHIFDPILKNYIKSNKQKSYSNFDLNFRKRIIQFEK